MRINHCWGFLMLFDLYRPIHLNYNLSQVPYTIFMWIFHNIDDRAFFRLHGKNTLGYKCALNGLFGGGLSFWFRSGDLKIACLLRMDGEVGKSFFCLTICIERNLKSVSQLLLPPIIIIFGWQFSDWIFLTQYFKSYNKHVFSRGF